MVNRNISVTTVSDGHCISFDAMASPCEVLMNTRDKTLATSLGNAIASETWRIQDKFSRYQQSSVVGQLNQHSGSTCDIDNETFLLLQFAEQCYQLSDGLFDITSGILRKAWHFDGSSNMPTSSEINALLPFIGFDKINYTQHHFKMPKGMEIDFGGLGKEYAVDKAIQIAKSITSAPVLVNFGGDLAVTGARENDQSWHVGIDPPSNKGQAPLLVKIKNGAIATSGDANRFLLKDGQRYGHILNVQTGWPVENAPHAITVAAPQCIQAGLLATIALLQGKNAQAYLDANEISYWCIQ